MQYVKFILLALLALVAFKVAFTLMGDMGGETQSGDGLVMEPAIVNLGTVVKDKGYNFSASIRNNGQKTIKIARIERSCSCLQANPAKDTLQPGETVSVSGTLAPHQLGQFRYRVRFVEEDQSAPEHAIELVGNSITSSGSAPQVGSGNP